MSKLTFTQNKENDTMTLSFEGRIDTTTSAEFDSDIKSSLDGVTTLVLDFKKVSYISSSGLRVLLSTHKSMDEKGGKMIVSNPSKMVNEVFDVTGFGDVLNVER